MELEGPQKSRATLLPRAVATEGPTTRSGLPGVTEGDLAQQGGELQAELSGKDKKLSEKWEQKQRCSSYRARATIP